MTFARSLGALALVCILSSAVARSQAAAAPSVSSIVDLDAPTRPGEFLLAGPDGAADIYVLPGSPPAVLEAATAFAGDVERVTGKRPDVLTRLDGRPRKTLVVIGVLGHSRWLTSFACARRLQISQVSSHWESALTTVVARPMPLVQQALVIAGSDRRGAAYALFALSRAMGVSPWVWWADVPARSHEAIYLRSQPFVQHEPSVRYRGIFLNDEDWGLRPWAAVKMDPELHNIGPHTYARIFELLMRLGANTLWPAMHPGTLPFNAVRENARLADRWGIVMGSSHSEILLRNNVGEWNEQTDGPWNYQTNHTAMDAYWKARLQTNGRYENYYTVGLRGVHDTGLEATGSLETKARLVEQAMRAQRTLLRQQVNPNLDAVPQVIWLYKESLDLYRAGMRVPDDVTLGWTDDNYGYLRQLPTAAEARRKGGSGVYYHVSYWGFPHDYLWLCTTPPALIREELTKAYDHGARRYWILNVGDIKPAEIDIDYFLQLAWNEPAVGAESQTDYLTHWMAEQFPAEARALSEAMMRYYALSFIRKPEFMGFNGYDDGIHRTAFNPLAWGDQNRTRLDAWVELSKQVEALGSTLPAAWQAAFFELVGYPVEAAAAQNAKFLWTDRSYLDSHNGDDAARQLDALAAQGAYHSIQELTRRYNSLENGKWSGMMSDAPRERQVFLMPQVATKLDPAWPLPAEWGPSRPEDPTTAPLGFAERDQVVSINACHFTRSDDARSASWTNLPGLGISGCSVQYGQPGRLDPLPKDARAPWLAYSFRASTQVPAMLTLSLLPVFPLDSDRRQRFAIQIDAQPLVELDQAGTGEWHENSAPSWAENVLRNEARIVVPLAGLSPGEHTLRLLYRDPGVTFEHLTIRFPAAAPAYPVPPESGP